MTDLSKYHDNDFISDLIDYFIFTAYTQHKVPDGPMKDSLDRWVNKIKERIDLKLLP